MCSWNMLLHHSQHTKTMEDVEITEETTTIEVEDDVAPNVKEIWEVVVVAVNPSI